MGDISDFSRELRDLKGYLEMQERRKDQKEQRIRNALQRQREREAEARERISLVEDPEARRAALAACGWTSPPELIIPGRGVEMQGGLPGHGKHQ